MSRLILAYVEDYDVEDVKPFVSSLAHVSGPFDIVVFAHNLPSRTEAYLTRNGLRVQSTARFNFDALRTIYDVLRGTLRLETELDYPHIAVNRRLVPLVRLFGEERRRHIVPKYFWHCQSARYFYYLEYLTEHREHDRVLLTDVRDVVFQDDPFASHLEKGLHVYAEHPRRKIGEQRENAGWIEQLYGPDRLHALSDRPVICSGVTLGDRSSMVPYLRAMTQQMTEQYGSKGYDQGVHNHLIYSDALDDVTVHPHGHGSVLHLGIAPRASIQTDAEGRVLNATGEIVSIVHQYDRHPDLNRRIRAQHTSSPLNDTSPSTH